MARIEQLRARGHKVDVKDVFTERRACGSARKNDGCTSIINQNMPGANVYKYTDKTGPAAGYDLRKIYGW
jgi:hypothetical protein